MIRRRGHFLWRWIFWSFGKLVGLDEVLTLSDLESTKESSEAKSKNPASEDYKCWSQLDINEPLQKGLSFANHH